MCGVLIDFAICYGFRRTERLCGKVFLILENREFGVACLLFFIFYDAITFKGTKDDYA